MASFSGLGIGLSFLFGCILMGLVAELYYLLWVRKRIPKIESEDQYSNSSSSTTYGIEFSQFFCWKKPNSGKNVCSTQQVRNQEMMNGQEQDLELGTSKDMLLKGYGEDSVETELMRLHNLCGPPRFLFTIKEETKEDLESEDGKSRGDRSRNCSRTRSLSDIMFTPLSSPPFKGQSLDSYNCQGFNPLFESSSEAELNRLRSSPPPKFKFLRDAEEKLIKRLIEEAEKRVVKNGGSVQDCEIIKPSSYSTEEKLQGSFISFLAKSKVREPLQQIQVHNSTNSVKDVGSVSESGICRGKAAFKKPRMVRMGVLHTESGHSIINPGMQPRTYACSADVTGDIGHKPTAGVKWRGKSAVTSAGLQQMKGKKAMEMKANAVARVQRSKTSSVTANVPWK